MGNQSSGECIGHTLFSTVILFGVSRLIVFWQRSCYAAYKIYLIASLLRPMGNPTPIRIYKVIRARH